LELRINPRKKQVYIREEIIIDTQTPIGQANDEQVIPAPLVRKLRK
jgi:hypothetical protein